MQQNEFEKTKKQPKNNNTTTNNNNNTNINAINNTTNNNCRQKLGEGLNNIAFVVVKIEIIFSFNIYLQNPFRYNIE